MIDCRTPPTGIHRCRASEDAEAATWNLAALAQFANPTLLPPYPEHRRAPLIDAWMRALLRGHGPRKHAWSIAIGDVQHETGG